MAVANVPTLLRLISASVAVANKSGTLIKNVMNKGDLKIVDKGINDLQTEADRVAQRCIVSSLSAQFPKLTIIGEESLEPNEQDKLLITMEQDEVVLSTELPSDLKDIKEEDIVVWVDPLDGTSEFTQGHLDNVTVLIGIAVDGKPVSGIVHQPYYRYKEESDPNKQGRTIWSVLGSTVHGIEVKKLPDNDRIVVTTRNHPSQFVEQTLQVIRPKNFLRVGGVGYKVLCLIEGSANIYVYPSTGTKKWDTCAPEALLLSAGGRMTDSFGEPILYHKNIEHLNSKGLLASSSIALHSELLKLIPEPVKASLLKPNI